MGMFGDIDIASAKEFKRPGPGTYLMAVTRFEVAPTKNDDEKFGLNIRYTHMDGEFEGWDHHEWKALIPDPGEGATEDEQKAYERARTILANRLVNLGIPRERHNDVMPEDVLSTEVYVTLKAKTPPDERNPTVISNVTPADGTRAPSPAIAASVAATKAKNGSGKKANPFAG